MARLHSLKMQYTHTNTSDFSVLLLCILHTGAHMKPVRSVRHKFHPKSIPASQVAFQQADSVCTKQPAQSKHAEINGQLEHKSRKRNISEHKYFNILFVFSRCTPNIDNSTSHTHGISNITAHSKHGQGLFLLIFQLIFLQHLEQQYWKFVLRTAKSKQ